MQFDVHRTTVSGRAQLTVVGELDLATAPALTDAAERELSGETRELVVDLTGTTFMDSSGARALMLLARRAAKDGVAMQVVCPRSNSAVRLVVDLLDLQAVLHVVERPDGSGG